MALRPVPHRVVFALAASVLILAACTGPGADPASPAPPVPDRPDALPATTPDQFRAMLAELTGTPVVVNLWASWCVPCEAEIPMLVRAASDHPGVRFLGVNSEDSRAGAERFIARYRVPYPSVFDPDGAIKTDLGGYGLPVTVFYRADGTVEATVPSELSQDTLDEHLAAIATP